MSEWAVLCGEKDREAVMRVVGTIDREGVARLAPSADALRGMVMAAEPGGLGVVVGPLDEGISDINVAAAVASDGNARCVVLARPEASGSLRSRAARAGIDLVVDISGLEEGARTSDESASGCGGRVADEPTPPPPSERPRPVEATRSEGGHAPVLTVCSGRGGVGKTTVAAAMAGVAARWGMRVCLLDLDLSCGNAYSCFGLSSGTDLSVLAGRDALGEKDLDRLYVSAGAGVSLAGPCAKPEASELAMAGAGELIGRASEAFDLVLVDTSTTFTDAVAQAAQRADRLLVVSDGRPGTLSSLARTGGLAVRLGVARTRIARLENRSDPRGRANLALGRAEVGLEAARVYRVVEGGGEVADLMAAGRVADLVEPGYPFADSVASTLAQLLAELGCLPECDEARRAADGPSQRGWRGLFGMRREAR